jgi:hypothetical protein
VTGQGPSGPFTFPASHIGTHVESHPVRVRDGHPNAPMFNQPNTWAGRSRRAGSRWLRHHRYWVLARRDDVRELPGRECCLIRDKVLLMTGTAGTAGASRQSDRRCRFTPVVQALGPYTPAGSNSWNLRLTSEDCWWHARVEAWSVAGRQSLQRGGTRSHTSQVASS